MWYGVFLLMYAAMARMQWDAREVRTTRSPWSPSPPAASSRSSIVLDQVLFVVARGLHAVMHLNMLDPVAGLRLAALAAVRSAASLHAIVGTLEQIGLAHPVRGAAGPARRHCSSPRSAAGWPGRPGRIVEAMTALPDVIAGLFIYALFILTLGMQKSGLAASLALAITMMPIVARASEVVIRLVPGTLREASYALGSSQWRTVLNVVLPTARSGLATAVVLAMARGIGETAPVLVVSGVTKEFNFNPLSGPQVSLPLYIWEYAHIEAVNQTIVTRAFGGAVALIVVVMLLFALARKLGGAAPGELTRRQRRQLARQGART